MTEVANIEEDPTISERPLNIAILGAGRIAQKMANTLNLMAASAEYSSLAKLYAIASRSQEKADTFAQKFAIAHTYGSYEAMLADPNVDLVYIATPHSLHAQQAIACIQAGKNVLVEKAFALNLDETVQVINTAQDADIFCGEAMWTRFMPSRIAIDKVVSSGRLGAVTAINANLCYPLTHKARLTDKHLGGGALLDVGVYPLTFIDMIMGSQNINRIVTSMQPYSTGVDAQNSTTLYYDTDLMATAVSSMLCASDRNGAVYGTEGYMVCHNVNNVSAIDIYSNQHELLEHIQMPQQLTGYEYEIAAAVRAIRRGRTDCIEMTHADTLRMMSLLDHIRDDWNC